MSVINQVLKDLDRHGANTAAPIGVIVVNQPEASAIRWSMPIIAGLSIVLALVWWFWPSSPVAMAPLQEIPETAPKLQLSQQLSILPLPMPSPAEPVVDTVNKADAPKLMATMVVSPRLDTRLPEARPAPPEKSSVTAEMPPRVIKEVKPLPAKVQAEEVWRQAQRLIEQGRNQDARERLNSALRLDPEHLAARQSLIALELESSDRADAEALLREGMALHPNDAWFPRSLAQLLLQYGDPGQAAAILKTALGKRADAVSWSLYASTSAKLGRSEDAVLAYREALRLDSAQGNWWIGLAVALEQTGDTANAAAAYQRALLTRLNADLRAFSQQKVRELSAR